MLTQNDDSGPFLEFVKNDQPENWQWEGNVVYGAPIPEDLTGVSMISPRLMIEENMLLYPSSDTQKTNWPDVMPQVVGTDLIGNIRQKKSTHG